MTITLTAEHERIIQAQLATGQFHSAEEVLDRVLAPFKPQTAETDDTAKAQAAAARIRELRPGRHARSAGRHVLARIRASRPQILMAGFVLDVSACMPWCCEDEATRASEELLQRASRRETLHVPSLWPWEMMNAVAVSVRRSGSPHNAPGRFSSSWQLLISASRPLLLSPTSRRFSYWPHAIN